jgi:glycine/D-amino acid oxidase-like deaminating enzyme
VPAEAAATAARPIEEACYWLAGRRRLSDPPLVGRRETDIVIIGAGLTGLWTAIHLKTLDPGREIVVLEQGIAAYGGSGRNAGMLGETIDHSHQLAISHFGRKEAERLARLGAENLAALLGFLEERRIECALERNGQLQVALTPGQVDELREAAEVARGLGLTHYRLLDAAETRAELDSPRYLGGLLNERACLLDPVRLVEGLKREAGRVGVAFHERTRVTSLDTSGAGVRLTTEHVPGPAGPAIAMEATGVAATRLQAAARRVREAARGLGAAAGAAAPGAAGTIVARRAILATSAYTHLILPQVKSRFIPLYDYILVSEPLTAAQLERLGWRNRRGVTDARAFFKYYRLTPDNRILWGTSEAAYYPGNRVGPDCDHSERHYRELRDSFRRHFPALGDLGFPYAWGGAICSTTRFTPFFGTAGKGRVLYGLGYTGHGLGTTHLAGRILAHLALERPSPLLDLTLVRRKPFPYPPEPLRRLAVGAVTRALRRVDAGGRPGLLLRCLDAMGIGLSS